MIVITITITMMTMMMTNYILHEYIVWASARTSVYIVFALGINSPLHNLHIYHFPLKFSLIIQFYPGIRNSRSPRCKILSGWTSCRLYRSSIDIMHVHLSSCSTECWLFRPNEKCPGQIFMPGAGVIKQNGECKAPHSRGHQAFWGQSKYKCVPTMT